MTSHQEYNRKNCQRQWVRAIDRAKKPEIPNEPPIPTRKHTKEWLLYKLRPYLRLEKETPSEWGEANKERIIQKVKGPVQELLTFFTKYPGLKRLIGAKVMLYYNSATAKTFEEPTDSPSLQKEQTLLQPDTSQVKSKSR